VAAQDKSAGRPEQGQITDQRKAPTGTSGYSTRHKTVELADVRVGESATKTGGGGPQR
jgi:hypothetical protein